MQLTVNICSVILFHFVHCKFRSLFHSRAFYWGFILNFFMFTHNKQTKLIIFQVFTVFIFSKLYVNTINDTLWKICLFRKTDMKWHNYFLMCLVSWWGFFSLNHFESMHMANTSLCMLVFIFFNKFGKNILVDLH